MLFSWIITSFWLESSLVIGRILNFFVQLLTAEDCPDVLVLFAYVFLAVCNFEFLLLIEPVEVVYDELAFAEFVLIVEVEVLCD